ncbi:hypothetical protein GCM10010994_19240 [Chelatococcus reniformis]|uniref:Uncharacterized protein n=1 Tax=Chelatococcus reniformis TaxID=1494448 RepID=A0A916U5L7_9HYPH|nr:hypothetical protein GCM10010994_19240 [Chelatococcus reniformis]
MRTKLKEAGPSALDIEEIEVVWEGPAGQSYLDDVRELHGYMGAYATLDEGERRRMDEPILTVVGHCNAQPGRAPLQRTSGLRHETVVTPRRPSITAARGSAEEEQSLALRWPMAVRRPRSAWRRRVPNATALAYPSSEWCAPTPASTPAAEAMVALCMAAAASPAA